MKTCIHCLIPHVRVVQSICSVRALRHQRMLQCGCCLTSHQGPGSCMLCLQGHCLWLSERCTCASSAIVARDSCTAFDSCSHAKSLLLRRCPITPYHVLGRHCRAHCLQALYSEHQRRSWKRRSWRRCARTRSTLSRSATRSWWRHRRWSRRSGARLRRKSAACSRCAVSILHSWFTDAVLHGLRIANSSC